MAAVAKCCTGMRRETAIALRNTQTTQSGKTQHGGRCLTLSNGLIVSLKMPQFAGWKIMCLLDLLLAGYLHVSAMARFTRE